MCKSITLKERMTHFMADNARITLLPLITDIDLDIIARLEEDAADDSNVNSGYAKEVCKRLRIQMNNLTPDNIAAQRAIYNLSAEARIFYSILLKVQIERVRECTVKKPDFRIEFGGREFFAEIKALSMAGSDEKYRTIAYDGLEAQINIEKQLNMGRRVASSITFIQPAFIENCEYDPWSFRAVVELLIKKATGLFKPDQFKYGPTIMFLDVGQWSIGCTLEEGCLEVFEDHITGAKVSGPLWHIAFGAIGSHLFRAPEFEGKSGADGVLEQEGLLRQFPDIKSLVFHDGHSSSGKLVGFMRSADADELKPLLACFTDFLSDEKGALA